MNSELTREWRKWHNISVYETGRPPHTWLARAEFVTGYIDAGTRHDGHPYAYIDWERAVAALDTRNLSCSPSEAGILRIAASLGDHRIPVHLARVLGSLDHTNITLVTTAITRANG